MEVDIWLGDRLFILIESGGGKGGGARECINPQLFHTPIFIRVDVGQVHEIWDDYYLNAQGSEFLLGNIQESLSTEILRLLRMFEY